MKKFAVIVNTGKPEAIKAAEKLVKCLISRAEVFMEKSVGVNIEGVFFCENVFENADCAIVLGGDGTILRAAADCAKQDIPILGINLGTVGFMTEVEVCEIEDAVDCLISGKYEVEERMMLKVSAKCDGEEKEYHALNDVVMSKTDESKLIKMDLYSGGEMMCRYVADGLIISTPTGSTGYNLSAGGPVVDPLMELFIATPICAHMLTARPAVMPSGDELKISLRGDGVNSAVLTVDGDVFCKLENNAEVLITKSEHKTKIIKIHKRSFYNIFTGKLS